MIHDARTDLPEVLEADVAIAGGGPAGIVLALELAERGRRVLLIEGGGRQSPNGGTSIYDNTTSGRPYPLTGSRLRWLGGTSNHWGGWVRPFDPRDFTDAPSGDLPGWPIDADALNAGYRRAAAWCEVGSADYDVGRIGLERRARLLDLANTGFEHRVFRFSPPTRFGSRYAESLDRSELIDCRVNLNLVELQQSEDAVSSARAVTFEGRSCTLRARHFVIAMGGVENARFLLDQARVPGNQAGLVGGGFMDHFGFTPGLMLADAGLQYERGRIAGDDLMTVMAPSAGTEGPNSCVLLTSTAPDDILPPAYWTNRTSGNAAGGHYRISMINAPTARRESRITLGDERDRLGLRRPHLHWHLPPTEFEPVIALFERWMDAIGARNRARIKWTRKTPPDENDNVGVGYHHMGTTRMSADPADGVVDPDGRVWDRDNLYVAGSSVYPAAGFANPTLTICALAVRMAAHLDQRLEA
ncbi:GMC family oxidoreductase [Wenzhouxiangella sp. XN79A]|uniref:GMC oxidoreductase n=1 Tax=Wenzhouxiangella sp. XN79A TaxID=2724193 RepID=UPI00144AE938|nr:GMC oxidoreductase [Wenzhouxiangella sp. XN79A]NKI34123.1 GMC family oxidoreductase [Wenzhouxiangella sp. XN79A]